MLANDFPYVGGLQAVWVIASDGCESVGTPEEDFVQILNVHNNHWITLSNISCPKDTITVYDSLYDDISPSYKSKLLKQIVYMLFPKSKHVTLQWADVQKQRGLNDCGLFAIAIATSLCYGILPQGCVWMQEMMRGHLSTCFHQGSLTCFPESATGKQNQKHLRVEKVEVFCHCRQPYTKDLFMIECERCKDWFHRGCQIIPRNVNKKTPFFRKNCK